MRRNEVKPALLAGKFLKGVGNFFQEVSHEKNQKRSFPRKKSKSFPHKNIHLLHAPIQAKAEEGVVEAIVVKGEW